VNWRTLAAQLAIDLFYTRWRHPAHVLREAEVREARGVRHQKWRLANARPEPDLRYFSKAAARFSPENGDRDRRLLLDWRVEPKLEI